MPLPVEKKREPPQKTSAVRSRGSESKRKTAVPPKKPAVVKKIKSPSARTTPPRVQAVRAAMAERECSHALITDAADVEYISGFRSSNAALLITPARLDLFTDFRYMEAARAFCGAPGKWRLTLIEESDFRFLKRKVRPGSALGIQSDSVTVDRYFDLEKALPGVEFVSLAEEIAGVSMQKTDSEIESMRAAAAIGDKALEALMPVIKEGVTEIELARALEGFCAEGGSEKPAFDTIALFGERSALPHGRPGERKLAAGEFVLIDFGCTVNGFHSDMTRTFVYGTAGEEQRKIYDTVLMAQKRARNAARAGMMCKELDKIARSAIEESGYGEYFGHSTGHGVGLRIHEAPKLGKKSGAALPENCVVTIEPGIYVPEVGGVRIEDMVVLKEGGAETLTHSPRGLTELPL